ncbi:30S ribosomal protein S3 [Halobacteriales archaeon SW_12_71_31]|nr:MAG: 30S ribosomal protein S3 [Halobacteriales archaeon SW_12_71_31]
MSDEQDFIHQGLQRTQIDRFFEEELGRAGYGGMEMAPTPMGTQIVLKAEKPGMVIGKGGENIRKITTALEEQFDLEDPQIDVQEVDEPDLNARIVADRLANALERGWYFRNAGHTTLERIMDAGALGAEIVLAGKVTGARSRVEKFNEGYIKHNGEPAETIVDHGQSVAVMKLGTIGVNVKIIPPGAQLPDDFRVDEDADVEDLVADAEAAEESLEDLLEEPETTEDVGAEVPEGMPAEPGDDAGDDDMAADEPADVEEVEEFEEVEVPGEESVDPDLEEIDGDVEDLDASDESESEAEELLEEAEAEIKAEAATTAGGKTDVDAGADASTGTDADTDEHEHEDEEDEHEDGGGDQQ